MPAAALPARFSPGDQLFDAFRLERRLAGRAAVWAARGADGTRYALKLGSPEALAAEHAAAEAAAHAHVVRVVGWLRSGRVAGIAFEYLPGGDLVSLAGAHPRHWLSHLEGVVAALRNLHALGLVHRDVKARNVRLDAAGRAKLIDFGSAKPAGAVWTAGGTTAEARRAGRPAGPVTSADDVYALAVLLHELVHGRPPGVGRKLRPRAELAPEARPLAVLAEAFSTAPPARMLGLDAFADRLKSCDP